MEFPSHGRIRQRTSYGLHNSDYEQKRCSTGGVLRHRKNGAPLPITTGQTSFSETHMVDPVVAANARLRRKTILRQKAMKGKTNSRGRAIVTVYRQTSSDMNRGNMQPNQDETVHSQRLSNYSLHDRENLNLDPTLESQHYAVKQKQKAYTNARLRRKMIMKNKALKQICNTSDENSIDSKFSSQWHAFSAQARWKNNNMRVPLSPLCIVNLQNLSNVSNCQHVEDTARVVSKMNTPLKRSHNTSDENSPPPEGSSQWRAFSAATRMKKNKITNPLSSLRVESNQNLTNDQNYHSQGIASSNCNIVNEGSVIHSEVINPSSTLSSKSVTQPLSVIQSIPSMSLNMNEDVDDLRRSWDGQCENLNNEYKKAESEEVIDFGSPTFMCENCGALMWYEERAEKCARRSSPQFSLCCMKGVVQLPLLRRPPDILYSLLNGEDSRSVHYRENIRAYNSMFAFTSMGGKVENTYNHGGAPPQFVIGGQNYHCIGSLLPLPGSKPKFAQLYIYDTQNETANRFHHFRSKDGKKNMNKSLIEDLTKMVDQYNVLAQSYRRVKDYISENTAVNLSLRLFRNRSKDARIYNLPTTDEVAALIVGDFQDLDIGRDVIVKKIGGELTRIHETHTAFIPLQYPLLFPYGEDGYHDDIYMIHGPCGPSNLKSPCMKNGKCSKFFPKKFTPSTTIDDEGYPSYKRRDSGLFVFKKGVKLDNRFVVPYNPYLLMRYQAHVNMEYCNKSNSIKYLFKYVNKGPDRATIEISKKSGNGSELDEIKQFYDCRYLAPCEAVWRTFAYDIHCRWPSVQRLSFHLPNQQNIFWKDEDDMKFVLEKNEGLQTMFLAWFEANKKYEEGRELTYAEFPTKFVYFTDTREWQLRKQGNSIGRLNFVPVGSGELYYMRILLTFQKGCTSFECIRTVNGVTYKTFYDACYALGLLDDDREFIDAIREASVLGSGHHLRQLFVSLLVMNSMSSPFVVWKATWRLLCDGILYNKRKELNIPGLPIGDNELQNLCLIEIDKLLAMNGKTLKDFPSLPSPIAYIEEQFQNKYLIDELNYDKEELSKTHQNLLSSLTAEQKSVYESIMNVVMSDAGGFFFLYGYGGTGKTYVWNTLSAAIRSKGMIVLNVASSGIASLLLPGGKTAHSTFCIPLVTTEESTCNIKQGSMRAKLILQTKLIIWDEAPMLNKMCFEAVDRSMRDIMRVENEDSLQKPFGGKVVVFGGDFRQILPVIRKGSRHEIVSATINSSELWKHCKVLKLTRNMRLGSTSSHEERADIEHFADWILSIGNGEQESNELGESEIHIPQDLLISECDNPLKSLVQFTYPDILKNMANFKFFEERAILAPTLEAVEYVNEFVLSMIQGDEMEYISSDSIVQSDEDCEVQSAWFTTEFLNDMKCSGLPNHRLKLKVGIPVILMRNIDQANGLCNGTRLLVNQFCKNVIGATVITGKNIGDKIFIPRLNLIPSDPGFPFKFQRRQFPISVCFAMTINKSQGQSLSQVGLYLQKPVFTHGQMYVAVSRIKARKGLKFLILDEEGKTSSSTTNVVYKEVFSNL